MSDLTVLCVTVALLTTCGVVKRADGATPAIHPIVEVEEEVYSYEPANNGAGPLWCSGSTCLVRIDKDLFASGLETIKNAKPLNNCRWLLFKHGAHDWQLQQSDPDGRTREPCPVAGFPGGPLFLSGNPTLTPKDTYAGPAQPEILEFALNNTKATFEHLLPEWQGQPAFTEHSYRSFAADGPNRELILFQNIGYTHAEWCFRNRQGKWSAQGQLTWPEGKDYPKPQPIRICYPDVALKSRAVYFCGVSDIVEPYPEWRTFKKQLTGQAWDYDFRRLFFTWTPNITREKFRPWVEIATRDKTGGWISPGDLWVAPDGAAHLVWIERALDERLREKFFPGARQSVAMNYAVVREGKVILRRSLVSYQEGSDASEGTPASPRFQVAPDNRLFLVYYTKGRDSRGKAFAENRLVEIRDSGAITAPVRVPLAHPFTSYFTATPRAGSPPSSVLELLGLREGSPTFISYSRIRIF